MAELATPSFLPTSPTLTLPISPFNLSFKSLVFFLWKPRKHLCTCPLTSCDSPPPSSPCCHESTRFVRGGEVGGVDREERPEKETWMWLTEERSRRG
ncbi:hypothetical protein D8674_024819 [Pyrus ussuriensis x Pyrus communis]|uniref:Uncharacterized protein n=1 Tax=Pyrus ussuriensis x Pyrus communis TaxID=2448454 RepID=A0A5N5H6L7_9ROSA|nr:hypothetical protein D8674_024819 [Pyrus ussuriensis x Pyrus communis]